MGRATIPDSVLMPALKIFREKGGIGEGRQHEFSPVPAPASTAAVATTEPEVDEDDRYHAVLNTPVAETTVLPGGDPLIEVSSPPTWVDVAPPEVVASPEVVAESEAVTEPDPAIATEPVPGAEVDAPVDAPDVTDEDSSGPARWLGSDFDEAISPEETYAMEAGEALDERPRPPAPQQGPPWLEAAAADAEDMEAHGRRLIEEDLEAERIRASVIRLDVAKAVSPLLPSNPPEPEPRPALEADRATWQPAPPESPDAPQIPAPAPRSQTQPRRRPAGLESLDTQVKIGLAIAAAIVLLLAVVFGLPRLVTTPVQPVATTSTSPAPAAPPTPGTVAAAAPSPQAPAEPVVPALTGLVRAGYGGSGYRVYRVRSLSPGGGLYLVAFDLQGSGPLPDVQLGQAADQTLYLQSGGTTIDPAIAGAFPGAGPVTAMSPTGAATMSLKLTTSRPAHFSMYYLTGPSRLVIQLR